MDKIVRSPTFLFFFLLALLVLGVLLVVRSGSPGADGSMTSAERARELAGKGMREQILTYNTGLVPLPEPSSDGEKPKAPNLFAIPVGQITLDEPEPRQRVSSVGGTFRGFNGNSYGRIEDPAFVVGVRGAFNNVLILDKRTGGQTKIFEKRVSISFFELINRVTPRIIAFIGTSIDSNKDGRLNVDDMQQLFIYTIDDGKLREVSGLPASVDEIETVDGVEYLVVAATIDRNKNGEPEHYSYQGAIPEPRLLYRVDLKTLAVTPLVDAAIANDLQLTLDGANGFRFGK